MTITFRHGEGSATTTRPILSIVGGLVTLSGTLNLATPLVGDSAVVVGTTSADGFYHITVINTAPTPDTYQIRPAPANQGAGGTLARLNRAVPVTVSGAGTITAITALTGGYALVEVAGANFKQNRVNLNDRLVVTLSSTTANNGAWYFQEIISDVLAVVRAPDGGAGMTTQGASGSISIRRGVHRFLLTDEGIATLTGAAVLTFNSGAQTIVRDVGDWAAEGFLALRNVLVESTVFNNGTLGPLVSVTASTLTFASGVVDEGLLTPVAGVRVRQPVSCQRIVDVGVPLATNVQQGSGVAADYFRSRRAGGDFANNPRMVWTMHGVTIVEFSNPSAADEPLFLLEKEFLFNADEVRTGTTGDMQDQRWSSNNSPNGPMTIMLGVQPGGRFSARNPSMVLGVRILVAQFTSFAMKVEGFASLWDGISGLGQQLRTINSRITGCILGNTQLDEGCVVESPIFAGINAPLVGSTDVDVKNVLVANSEQTAAFINTATFEGLLIALGLSDVWNVAAAVTVNVLNPRVDYDISQFFLVSALGGFVEKRYTFNPRFITNVGTTIVPISGLTVTLSELQLFGEVVVFSGVTDVNGQINGGVGFDFRCSSWDGTDLSLFNKRVEVSGAGFQTLNWVRQARAFLDEDFFVPAAGSGAASAGEVVAVLLDEPVATVDLTPTVATIEDDVVVTVEAGVTAELGEPTIIIEIEE